eukprot:2337067-Prymnesium_polylepis.1
MAGITNDTVPRLPHVIAMGLPKTGTTSVAGALSKLGYQISHHEGDQLRFGKGCNAILNTLED